MSDTDHSNDRREDPRAPSQTRDDAERDAGRDPSHIAYTVRDQGADKKSVWTRIGASWPHRDGDGMDVQLDATPVDGRLTLRAFRREEYERARETGQRRSDRGPSRGR